MLEFTSDVPKDPRGAAFPILRTPTAKPLTAIVTSTNLVGTFTHFWKGRTMPHSRGYCEACDAGMPYRWHAYLAVVTAHDHMHVIFECTAQAAESFTDYREAHGTIRGCYFTARRMHCKPNGRIIIQCKPADLTGITLPKGPNLPSCLAILWGLSDQDVAADSQNPEKKTRQVTHNPRTKPRS